MTKSVLFDTDVLIDFLRGQSKAVALVTKHMASLALSAVALAELYAGVRDDEERAELDAFAGLFAVYDVTSEIAREGGLLKQRFGRSRGVGLADAIIAATAICHGLELKTLNTKHYPMLKGLLPAYRK